MSHYHIALGSPTRWVFSLVRGIAWHDHCSYRTTYFRYFVLPIPVDCNGKSVWILCRQVRFASKHSRWSYLLTMTLQLFSSPFGASRHRVSSIGKSRLGAVDIITMCADFLLLDWLRSRPEVRSWICSAAGASESARTHTNARRPTQWTTTLHRQSGKYLSAPMVHRYA